MVISIDDFYLTRSERYELANDIHALFVTRGVPGTHDLGLLQQTITDCGDPQALPFSVPVFDKATDDRAANSDWQVVTEEVDIIILEGWCVGLTAQAEASLLEAINELEKNEDLDQRWRRYINEQLATKYAEIYKQFDCLIALQAPSFECVYEWRTLQEEKLIQSLAQSNEELDSSKVMSPDQLKRFISHYERLTRHALETMPQQADFLLKLQEDHGFSALISNQKGNV